MKRKPSNIFRRKDLPKEFYIGLAEALNMPIEYLKAVGGILKVDKCRSIIWKYNKHKMRKNKPQQ